MVSTLITAIKTRSASVLGATWSEIQYARDVGKNPNNATKRYGAIPKEQYQVSGVLGALTIDQVFEVVLLDKFVNTTSDSTEQTLAITLQEQAFALFKDFMTAKLGSSQVINITDYSCDEPETNQESKNMVVRFQFTVRYRQAI